MSTPFNTYVSSMQEILDKDYDAVFVGTGAPRGRDLSKLPGPLSGGENVHIGIDWLASVAFGHVDPIGKRVLVLGGGNTAMDCCRTARRLGGDDVKVVVRSPLRGHEGLAVGERGRHARGHPDPRQPRAEGVRRRRRQARRHEFRESATRSMTTAASAQLVPTGEPPVFFDCDDVLMAIGQENAFPWIERDIGIEFDKWDMPVLDR